MAKETRGIKPGDRVVIADQKCAPLTVSRIKDGGPDGPWAYFEEGGFWRISQLRKVAPND